MDIEGHINTNGDDICAYGVYNSGTAKGTDCFYLGRNPYGAGTLVSSTAVSIYWGATMQGAEYGGTNAGYSNPPWPGTGGPPTNTDNTWNLFESHTGKAMSAVPVHLNFTVWDANPHNHARSRGAFCVLSVGVEGTSIVNIKDGVNNAAIDSWAASVASYGQPIMIRPWWEMNGNWGYPWQAAVVSAADYVSAWQLFRTRCDAQGATNLSWLWCPNGFNNAINSGFTQAAAAAYYPGDAYVDWVGADVYNKLAASHTVPECFDNVYSGLQTIGSGKPQFWAETASLFYSSGTSQAQWITDLLTALPTNYPNIKGFLWYNTNGGSSVDGSGATETFPIENTSTTPGIHTGTSAGTTAFAAGIASSYYKANIVNTTTFPSGAKVPVP